MTLSESGEITVIVTRPKGQGASLAERFQSHGWKVLQVPALAIEFRFEAVQIEAALARIGELDLLHFASANAIAGWVHALSRLHRNIERVCLRPTAWLAVMGEGSRAELDKCWPHHGASVLTPGAQLAAAPQALDSETLLQTLDSLVPQPISSGWSGKRALLIKGDGGRSTLADGLLLRNMEVDALSVYRRLPPLLAAEAVEALEMAERPVVVFSSSEGVVAFGQMLDREPVLAGQWRSWPVIATHERVAQAARSLSCKTVRSVPPHDEAIIRAIESLS